VALGTPHRFAAFDNLLRLLPCTNLSLSTSQILSRSEERYQNKYGVLRDVVREVVCKYLGCGDLKRGFTRIKCKYCKHEVLLAFSCKGRYFCPSCYQKSVLMFGEWIH
jgi:hypothetical protein